jgi:hypothetical protein
VSRLPSVVKKFPDLYERRNECISLGLRMNAAGWNHGSIWERNILKQPGPLNEPPFRRMMNVQDRNRYGVDWSFRLIDFGRSRHVEDFSDGHLIELAEETKKLKEWWQSGAKHWG